MARLGSPFVAATSLLLLIRRKRALELSAVVLGLLAAAATLATAASFALASNASEGRWVEAGNEVVFVIVGLAVVARGSPSARTTAAGALGLLGLFVGLSKLPVLMHGVVPAAVPATMARAEVALTVWRAPLP